MEKFSEKKKISLWSFRPLKFSKQALALKNTGILFNPWFVAKSLGASLGGPSHLDPTYPAP